MFLVPVRDNDGRLFRRAAWDALEDRLETTFGGFSQAPGIRGRWRVGNRVYRDTSRQYVVAIEAWGQLPAWLDLVEWVRVAFGQEAIYIEVAGIPEIFAGRTI
jgi:hypothetical protein